ncbi:DNA repair protein RecN [Lacticaseibacillus mingshuiensis]|uniref:DNA repair protein RecN n=1 Tax=Lacticaseibacillus mingshuiensis TaxID=2799574 RepID=A0ABW4CJ21_9LACO|nr:DNA repair protein RecN [Lacticaseibacillus mingshuiensis]
MLQELEIHDFAIIDQLQLSFADRMTALTGETGAGKSIIIDAVSLLAGSRGSADFVRTGATKATLEGLFDATSNPRTAAVMSSFGLQPDEGSVLLSRELYENGRNICRVNGHLVNTATLRAIGETLVDIHGQNEHQQLIHAETHLGLLDAFAGAPVLDLLADYQTRYAAYQTAAKALRKKQANEQEWAQRLDMLTFQVDEISSADLQPDEATTLTQERDRLANYQRISDALTGSYDILNGEEANPLDQIASAMEQMQGIAHLDTDFASIASDLQTAYYSLQDTQSALSRQVDDLEWDEGRLDEVEKRLDLISQLERKYGNSVQDVIDYGEKAKRELASMTATEAGDEGLEGRVASEKKALITLGHQLHDAREKADEQLSTAIHKQLAALYMAKTVFSVRLTALVDELRPDGTDSCEFYIQTNPGEAAKPLAKIASGGELSRIMLALKTIFAETDGVTSIIFDEVDTGVSGRVAQAIANKISQIAHHSQVLCITHLPQVAAMSDHEYLITKKVTHGRTMTEVTKLSDEARVHEIARMLAGTEVTQLALEHAQEMLTMAAQTKAKLHASA